MGYFDFYHGELTGQQIDELHGIMAIHEKAGMRPYDAALQAVRDKLQQARENEAEVRRLVFESVNKLGGGVKNVAKETLSVGIQHLDTHEKKMLITESPRLLPIRSEGRDCLPRLDAQLQAVSGGYGYETGARDEYRQDRSERELRTGELQMGHGPAAGGKPSVLSQGQSGWRGNDHSRGGQESWDATNDFAQPITTEWRNAPRSSNNTGEAALQKGLEVSDFRRADLECSRVVQEDGDRSAIIEFQDKKRIFCGQSTIQGRHENIYEGDTLKPVDGAVMESAFNLDVQPIFESAGKVVMTLIGNEIDGYIPGKMPNKRPTVGMLTLRDRAEGYYKDHFQGKDAHRSDLSTPIRISNKGLDEFIHYSSNPDKLRLVPAIKAIIEHGEYEGREPLSHPRQKDRIVAFHLISANVVLSGKTMNVRIELGEDQHGHLFYDLFPDKESHDIKRKSRIRGVESESTGNAAQDQKVSLSDNSTLPLPPDAVKPVLESASTYDYRTAIEQATTFEDIQAVFERVFPGLIAGVAE